VAGRNRLEAGEVVAIHRQDEIESREVAGGDLTRA